jgi:hypothetical protein
MGGLTHRHQGGFTDGARLVSTAAGVLLIGAGLLHVSAAAEHQDLPVMVAGFLASAYLQVALGGLAILRRPGRLLIAAGVAMSVACVGLWLVSRTTGLPAAFGEPKEPVGVKDGVCVLFELATLPALLLLASRDLPAVTLSSPALGLLGGGALALFVPAVVVNSHHHLHSQLHASGHPHSAPAHAGKRHPRGHQLALVSGRVVHRGHGGSDGTSHARHASGAHTAAAHAGSAHLHAGHLATGGLSGHTGHVHTGGGAPPVHQHGGGGHTHRKGGPGGGHRHTSGGHQHAGGGGQGHAGHPPGAPAGDGHHHHPEPQPEDPVTAVTRQVTELLPPRRR